jgi:hypothetical protein
MLISMISLVLIAVIGVSFAYFSAITSGGESVSTILADSGSMTIVYDNGSGVLTAHNIAPDSDTPFITKTFTVTGTNTTDKIMPYTLSLVIDNNTFSVKALTYTLESVNTSNSGEVVPAFSGTGVPTTNGTYSFGDGYFVNGSSKVHTYTLKLYFPETNENQNADQNKTFAAHIAISAGKSLKEPKNWSTAATGTLLKAIKTNNTLSAPKTRFGYPSLSTESVMAPAEDDYGTSYYFRGNITNNYVVFAGMCWRIVRVTGDGSIKLALYNYNPSSVTNPCDTSQDGTSNAFARYTVTTYQTVFNTNRNDNAYVGLMYGTAGSTSYAATHANTNKSTILTNLETWYTSKIATYSSKLADTIWCNDKSMTPNLTSKSSNGSTYSYPGLGYGTSVTFYNAGLRLYGMEQGSLGIGPTLVCPNDNDGGKLSKFTADDTTYGNGALDYKIGLLTIDELEMSGYPIWSYYNSSETTYYLNKNATDRWYWSSSPIEFNSDLAFVYGAGGDRLVVDIVNGDTALRPSVSLVSATTISSGTGTSSSPYVVS